MKNPTIESIPEAKIAVSPFKFLFNAKKSRADIVAAITAETGISQSDKEYILFKIGQIPMEHDILHVTIVGMPHKGGFNFTFTACEI